MLSINFLRKQNVFGELIISALLFAFVFYLLGSAIETPAVGVDEFLGIIGLIVGTIYVLILFSIRKLKVLH